MMPVALLAVLAALLTLGVGPAVMLWLSRASGWKELSAAYPSPGPLPRPYRAFGHGVFRGWIGYNGGIWISADGRGLYLFPMPWVLSWCHDPIFIPWPEIRQIEQQQRWFGLVDQVWTRSVPGLDFALRRGTFDFVRARAREARVPGNY